MSFLFKWVLEELFVANGVYYVLIGCSGEGRRPSCLASSLCCACLCVGEGLGMRGQWRYWLSKLTSHTHAPHWNGSNTSHGSCICSYNYLWNVHLTNYYLLSLTHLFEAVACLLYTAPLIVCNSEFVFVMVSVLLLVNGNQLAVTFNSILHIDWTLDMFEVLLIPMTLIG